MSPNQFNDLYDGKPSLYHNLIDGTKKGEDVTEKDIDPTPHITPDTFTRSVKRFIERRREKGDMENAIKVKVKKKFKISILQ